MRSLSLSALFIFLMVAISPSYAQVLCVRKSQSLSKSKVPLSSAIRVAARCPAGFVRVLDTATFKGQAGNTGPQGPRGATGPTGPVGPSGASGADGASAFDTLASGTTVRGVITISNGQNAGFGTFNALVPQLVADADVIIARNSVLGSNINCSTFSCLSAAEASKNASACSGSESNPTAPPGKVCIYPRTATIPDSTTRIEGRAQQFAGQNYFFRPYFHVQVVSGTIGATTITGTWAYTAP
jgi:hypothetical protein